MQVMNFKVKTINSLIIQGKINFRSTMIIITKILMPLINNKLSSSNNLISKKTIKIKQKKIKISRLKNQQIFKITNKEIIIYFLSKSEIVKIILIFSMKKNNKKKKINIQIIFFQLTKIKIDLTFEKEVLMKKRR